MADGVYLYNHIRAVPIDMTVHATGTVASIAATVLLGADKRVCSSHAMFMMHPTSVGPFQHALPAEQLESALKMATADDDRTDQILKDRANLPDDILKLRRIGDVHLPPEEALKFGLVHSIEEFAVPAGAQLIQI